MRNLTPQRRAAVIAASCAAIVPSLALLTESSHRPAVHNVCGFCSGFIIGLSFTLCIGFLIRTRNNCA